MIHALLPNLLLQLPGKVPARAGVARARPGGGNDRPVSGLFPVAETADAGAFAGLGMGLNLVLTVAQVPQVLGRFL